MYDNDVIKNEILDGLLQVDSSFSIEDFSCEVNGRTMNITFKAQNSDGESIEVKDLWR